MKEFPGKAVLSMAAQGGLLHGGVQQTEKIFSAEGGTWGRTGENPVIARGTWFSGAKRGGPEKRRRVGEDRL